LDPITRDTLQDLVKELQQKLGKTFIFVTHDMDEAIKLADKICIMSEGKVVQYDTPDNILRHPANDFVRDFIGQNRLIQDRPNKIGRASCREREENTGEKIQGKKQS